MKIVVQNSIDISIVSLETGFAGKDEHYNQYSITGYVTDNGYTINLGLTNNNSYVCRCMTINSDNFENDYDAWIANVSKLYFLPNHFEILTKRINETVEICKKIHSINITK